MKTQTVLSIVVAFIAIFVTGCANSYQGGRTVRYQTQNQPTTRPLSVYGNQPKLSEVNRSGLTTKILSQAFDTNEVWNEYKSCARRVVLPDNTLVLVSSEGYVWKADCGNRLLQVQPEQVIVHRPAPVQTVVVQDQPEVRYVHRRGPTQTICVQDAPRVRYVQQRSYCPPRPCGEQYIGGAPIGGYGNGPGFWGWATSHGWNGLNSSYYRGGGGQVPFGSFRGGGSSSFSGASNSTRIINNNTNVNRIRIRF